MKQTILLFITLAGLAFLQSCQYDWLDPIDPVLPEVVSYSADIQPIWDRSCNSAGCHSAGGISPDLTPANSYNSLFAKNQIDLATPENSRLYIKCAPGGSMNKFCQPGDPELILKWIEEGAENN